MTWNAANLTQLIQEQQGWVVEVEGDCLSISNDEGIDAFLYAGDKQIIVETALFPQGQVKDIALLNDLILRSHQLVPLTTIGLNRIAGEDYYVAFGALSIDSKPEVVLEEIETLFANVDEFLELYGAELKQEHAA